MSSESGLRGALLKPSKPLNLTTQCSGDGCGNIIFIPGKDVPNELDSWDFKCVDCGGKYKEPEGWC